MAETTKPTAKETFSKALHLEKISLSSPECIRLVHNIKRTNIDPEFRDRYWRTTSVHLVKNETLKKGFLEFKNEQKASGRRPEDFREVLVFSSESKKAVEDISREGTRIGTKKRHVLGHAGSGVHLVRHYDVLTRYMVIQQGNHPAYILVYKGILGKTKPIVPRSHKEDNFVKPYVGFDCHVSARRVEPKMQIGEAYRCSHIYFYENDDVKRCPVRTPRQILPFAVIEIERKHPIHLESPFLAVGSKVTNWEVKGETRRGFRFALTKPVAKSESKTISKKRKNNELKVSLQEQLLEMRTRWPETYPISKSPNIENNADAKLNNTSDPETQCQKPHCSKSFMEGEKEPNESPLSEEIRNKKEVRENQKHSPKLLRDKIEMIVHNVSGDDNDTHSKEGTDSCITKKLNKANTISLSQRTTSNLPLFMKPFVSLKRLSSSAELKNRQGVKVKLKPSAEDDSLTLTSKTEDRNDTGESVNYEQVTTKTDDKSDTDDSVMCEHVTTKTDYKSDTDDSVMCEHVTTKTDDKSDTDDSVKYVTTKATNEGEPSDEANSPRLGNIGHDETASGKHHSSIPCDDSQDTGANDSSSACSDSLTLILQRSSNAQLQENKDDTFAQKNIISKEIKEAVSDCGEKDGESKTVEPNYHAENSTKTTMISASQTEISKQDILNNSQISAPSSVNENVSIQPNETNASQLSDGNRVRCPELRHLLRQPLIKPVSELINESVVSTNTGLSAAVAKHVVNNNRSGSKTDERGLTHGLVRQSGADQKVHDRCLEKANISEKRVDEYVVESKTYNVSGVEKNKESRNKVIDSRTDPRPSLDTRQIMETFKAVSKEKLNLNKLCIELMKSSETESNLTKRFPKLHWKQNNATVPTKTHSNAEKETLVVKKLQKEFPEDCSRNKPPVIEHDTKSLDNTVDVCSITTNVKHISNESDRDKAIHNSFLKPTENAPSPVVHKSVNGSSDTSETISCSKCTDGENNDRMCNKPVENDIDHTEKEQMQTKNVQTQNICKEKQCDTESKCLNKVDEAISKETAVCVDIQSGLKQTASISDSCEGDTSFFKAFLNSPVVKTSSYHNKDNATVHVTDDITVSIAVEDTHIEDIPLVVTETRLLVNDTLPGTSSEENECSSESRQSYQYVFNQLDGCDKTMSDIPLNLSKHESPKLFENGTAFFTPFLNTGKTLKQTTMAPSDCAKPVSLIEKAPQNIGVDNKPVKTSFAMTTTNPKPDQRSEFPSSVRLANDVSTNQGLSRNCYFSSSNVKEINHNANVSVSEDYETAIFKPFLLPEQSNCSSLMANKPNTISSYVVSRRFCQNETLKSTRMKQNEVSSHPNAHSGFSYSPPLADTAPKGLNTFPSVASAQTVDAYPAVSAPLQKDWSDSVCSPKSTLTTDYKGAETVIPQSLDSNTQSQCEKSISEKSIPDLPAMTENDKQMVTSVPKESLPIPGPPSSKFSKSKNSKDKVVSKNGKDPKTVKGFSVDENTAKRFQQFLHGQLSAVLGTKTIHTSSKLAPLTAHETEASKSVLSKCTYSESTAKRSAENITQRSDKIMSYSSDSNNDNLDPTANLVLLATQSLQETPVTYLQPDSPSVCNKNMVSETTNTSNSNVSNDVVQREQAKVIMGSQNDSTSNSNSVELGLLEAHRFSNKRDSNALIEAEEQIGQTQLQPHIHIKTEPKDLDFSVGTSGMGGLNTPNKKEKEVKEKDIVSRKSVNEIKKDSIPVKSMTQKECKSAIIQTLQELSEVLHFLNDNKKSSGNDSVTVSSAEPVVNTSTKGKSLRHTIDMVTVKKEPLSDAMPLLETSLRDPIKNASYDTHTLNETAKNHQENAFKPVTIKKEPTDFLQHQNIPDKLPIATTFCPSKPLSLKDQNTNIVTLPLNAFSTNEPVSKMSEEISVSSHSKKATKVVPDAIADAVDDLPLLFDIAEGPHLSEIEEFGIPVNSRPIFKSSALRHKRIVEQSPIYQTKLYENQQTAVNNLTCCKKASEKSQDSNSSQNEVCKVFENCKFSSSGKQMEYTATLGSSRFRSTKLPDANSTCNTSLTVNALDSSVGVANGSVECGNGNMVQVDSDYLMLDSRNTSVPDTLQTDASNEIAEDLHNMYSGQNLSKTSNKTSLSGFQSDQMETIYQQQNQTSDGNESKTKRWKNDKTKKRDPDSIIPYRDVMRMKNIQFIKYKQGKTRNKFIDYHEVRRIWKKEQEMSAMKQKMEQSKFKTKMNDPNSVSLSDCEITQIKKEVIDCSESENSSSKTNEKQQPTNQNEPRQKATTSSKNLPHSGKHTRSHSSGNTTDFDRSKSIERCRGSSLEHTNKRKSSSRSLSRKRSLSVEKKEPVKKKRFSKRRRIAESRRKQQFELNPDGFIPANFNFNKSGTGYFRWKSKYKAKPYMQTSNGYFVTKNGTLQTEQEFSEWTRFKERESIRKNIESAIREYRKTFENTGDDVKGDEKVASYLKALTERLDHLQTKRNRLNKSANVVTHGADPDTAAGNVDARYTHRENTRRPSVNRNTERDHLENQYKGKRKTDDISTLTNNISSTLSAAFISTLIKEHVESKFTHLTEKLKNELSREVIDSIKPQLVDENVFKPTSSSSAHVDCNKSRKRRRSISQECETRSLGRFGSQLSIAADLDTGHCSEIERWERCSEHSGSSRRSNHYPNDRNLQRNHLEDYNNDATGIYHSTETIGLYGQSRQHNGDDNMTNDQIDYDYPVPTNSVLNMQHNKRVSQKTPYRSDSFRLSRQSHVDNSHKPERYVRGDSYVSDSEDFRKRHDRASTAYNTERSEQNTPYLSDTVEYVSGYDQASQIHSREGSEQNMSYLSNADTFVRDQSLPRNDRERSEQNTSYLSDNNAFVSDYEWGSQRHKRDRSEQYTSYSSDADKCVRGYEQASTRYDRERSEKGTPYLSGTDKFVRDKAHVKQRYVRHNRDRADQSTSYVSDTDKFVRNRALVRHDREGSEQNTSYVSNANESARGHEHVSQTHTREWLEQNRLYWSDTDDFLKSHNQDKTIQKRSVSEADEFLRQLHGDLIKSQDIPGSSRSHSSDMNENVGKSYQNQADKSQMTARRKAYLPDTAKNIRHQSHHRAERRDSPKHKTLHGSDTDACSKHKKHIRQSYEKETPQQKKPYKVEPIEVLEPQSRKDQNVRHGNDSQSRTLTGYHSSHKKYFDSNDSKSSLSHGRMNSTTSSPNNRHGTDGTDIPDASSHFNEFDAYQYRQPKNETQSTEMRKNNCFPPRKEKTPKTVTKATTDLPSAGESQKGAAKQNQVTSPYLPIPTISRYGDRKCQSDNRSYDYPY